MKDKMIIIVYSIFLISVPITALANEQIDNLWYPIMLTNTKTVWNDDKNPLKDHLMHIQGRVDHNGNFKQVGEDSFALYDKNNHRDIIIISHLNLTVDKTTQKISGQLVWREIQYTGWDWHTTVDLVGSFFGNHDSGETYDLHQIYHGEIENWRMVLSRG